MQSSSSLRQQIDSPEQNLVVQCARALLSSESHGLQTALSQPMDWTAVERSAERHSMTPLVAYALKQYGGDFVPKDARERLQQRLQLTARRNMVWLGEWRRILSAFETTDIPVISLKGPAFTLSAYENIALREFHDLDLLVQPQDVPRARDALVREGYRLRFAPTGDIGKELLRSGNRQLDFVNETRGTVVDLHWAVLHRMFSFQMPVDRCFESVRTEHRDVLRFSSLSPEHLLLYLCAHGAKHCWRNLRWLCDVAFHLQAAQTLDWDLCMCEAMAINASLVVQHSLLLAEQVLGAVLPSPVQTWCNDPRAQILAETARNFLFSDDDHARLSSRLAEAHFYLAFSNGWRQSIRLLYERVLAPSETEWQQFRLPRGLHFLYYAVRPARFVFGHWALRR